MGDPNYYYRMSYKGETLLTIETRMESDEFENLVDKYLALGGKLTSEDDVYDFIKWGEKDGGTELWTIGVGDIDCELSPLRVNGKLYM